MKIGLFGGTFNPVHHGHLINAEIVKNTFQLNKILFIPSKNPVHKNLEGNASPEDRFNMTKIAIEDNDSFWISRIELDRDEQSYFIITLKQLLKIYPDDELFLILGSDAFSEITIWKDWEEIIKLVALIVMRRPGSVPGNPDVLKKTKKISFIENPLIEISSSEIRENIKNCRPIKYLVPAAVEEYIIKRELYKN